MDEPKKLEEDVSPYMDYNIPVSFGTLFGIAIGSMEEATSSVDKKAEDAFKAALNKIRSSRAPDKLRQCWLMGDALRARFGHGPIAGGVRIGILPATFVGVYNWLVKNRGVDDMFNTGVAGTVAGGTLGLMVPGGSPFQRAERAIIAAVVGACVCFPIGQGAAEFKEKVNASRRKQNEQRDMKQHVAGATMKDSSVRG